MDITAKKIHEERRKMKNKIRLIPKGSSEKIVNTQVIPTAESAILEVIENAIDANAKTIEIRVLSTTSFSIRDDGAGIDENNFNLIGTERFTTTTRTSFEKCGCRGQSLLALAGLCTMKIVTKTNEQQKDASSKRIRKGILISQGADRRIAKTGQGTTVTVHELFENVPVRYKLLKKRNITSFLESVCVITKDYAICHPSISFQVYGSSRSRTSRTKSQLHIRPHESVLSRMLYFGIVEPHEEMIEIREFVKIDKQFRVRGVISREQKWNSGIKFYVNGRIVQRCFNLSRAVRRAYGSIFSSSNVGPLVILDVRCENLALLLGSQRYQIDSCDVFSCALSHFIRSLLRRSGYNHEDKNMSSSLIHQNQNDEKSQPRHDGHDVFSSVIHQNDKSQPLRQQPIVRPSIQATTYLSTTKRSVLDIAKDWKNPCLKREAEKRVRHDPKIDNRAMIRLSTAMLQSAKVISCVSRKFILATCTVPTDEENRQDMPRKLLLCFDQHAVHERIRLERLQANMRLRLSEGHLEYHTWPFPQLKYLSLEMERKLTNASTFLLRWGFRYLVSSSSSSSSSSSPSSSPNKRLVKMTRSCKILRVRLNVDDMIEFAEYCCDQVTPSSSSSSLICPPSVTRLLQSKACRGAIMFGDEITACQARALISQLANCKLPFQCAHGRPSVQVLSAFRRRKGEVGRCIGNTVGSSGFRKKSGSILGSRRRAQRV